MPIYNNWDYVPVLHDFKHIANIGWPHRPNEQLDWIQGITDVESWLLEHHMQKYSHWAWNMANEVYQISVAFKYDKHKMLFLLNYS